MPAMKQPMLVVWGRNDKFLPAQQADILKANLPDARVILFDACGHAPQGRACRGLRQDGAGFPRNRRVNRQQARADVVSVIRGALGFGPLRRLSSPH